MMPKPKPSPEPRILRGHEASVQAVSFLGSSGSSNDGEPPLLVTGDADGHVKLWDLGACRPRISWMPQQYSAPSLCMAPPTLSSMKGVLSLHALEQGRQLLTQLRGGTISLWDMGEYGGQPRPVRSWATGSFHFCKVSVGGNVSATASATPQQHHQQRLLLAPTAESEQFQLWDMRDGTRPAHTFAPSEPENRGLCMCLRLVLPTTSVGEGDGAGGGAAAGEGFALAVYEDGSLCGWDLRRCCTSFTSSSCSSSSSRSGSTAAFSVKLTEKETPVALDIGPSGNRGILGAAGCELVLFDLELAQHRCTKNKSLSLKHPGVGAVVVRSDEKLFATGGWDHRVRIFRWQDGAPLAVLRGHSESVNSLAFSSDMSTLVSVGKDARVASWEGLYPPTIPPP
ncbi:guanine nucleotide-binding protein subunit beta-like protein 1 homolog [Nannochloropsis oceanica]